MLCWGGRLLCWWVGRGRSWAGDAAGEDEWAAGRPEYSCMAPTRVRGQTVCLGSTGVLGGTLPLQGLAEASLEVVTSSGPVTALCHCWQSVSKTKNRQKEMSWIWGEREEQISLALRLGESKGWVGGRAVPPCPPYSHLHSPTRPLTPGLGGQLGPPEHTGWGPVGICIPSPDSCQTAIVISHLSKLPFPTRTLSLVLPETSCKPSLRVGLVAGSQPTGLRVWEPGGVCPGWGVLQTILVSSMSSLERKLEVGASAAERWL